MIDPKEDGKIKKEKLGDQYTVKSHMDWVDRENIGISHFGVHPELLPRQCIRFDVFHLRSAVTRLLLDRLRKFIREHTFEINNELEKILSRAWESWYVLVWSMNKPLSCMRGSHILAFIRIIPEVCEWLTDNFHLSDYMYNLNLSLATWQELSQFIHISRVIQDGETDTETQERQYEAKMQEFTKKLKEFYTFGSKSFLCKLGDGKGDLETFYLHTLRFYLPVIAEYTWDKYRLGLGVYTMQGFERRNKESKMALHRFTNKKGNIVKQSMIRLWDIFYFGKKVCISNEIKSID